MHFISKNSMVIFEVVKLEVHGWVTEGLLSPSSFTHGIVCVCICACTCVCVCVCVCPVEKALAPHSSVLAWRIPGTGEPHGLPSMGSHRVGHDTEAT